MIELIHRKCTIDYLTNSVLKLSPSDIYLRGRCLWSIDANVDYVEERNTYRVNVCMVGYNDIECDDAE